MATPNSSGFWLLLAATVALVLFLSVVFMGFGAGADPGTEDPIQEHANTDHSDNPEGGFKPDPMKCKEWPVPTAALILTGEQHGYIEPCGCTENQSGGVSRRGDLVRQLHELGWKTAGLDLGGLVKRNRLQSQRKFETMLAALKDLNYKAVAFGAEDVKLGPDYLLSQNLPDNPISFLNANVTFYDTPDLGTPNRTRVFEHGGLKFGVTSVMGDSLRLEIKQVEDVKFQPPADVLPAALESLEAEQVDLKILLAQGSLEEGRRLARDFPAFDLVLTAGGPEDPNGTPEAIGNTVLLTVGHKGKHAGVLAIYPDGDPKFRFELVQLDRTRFGDTPKMIEHMRYYQDQLKQQQIAVQESPVGHPSGATFVGSDACADCHEEEYAIWKKTGHAEAFASLDPKNERHGHERLKGIARMFDPECLACHVTGWNPQEVFRYRSGFINAEFAADEEERTMSPLLIGSGCENCHGPGSRHIELADNGEDELAIKEVRLTLDQANSAEGCYKCHDLDNSPTFDFDKYWEKIAH